LTDVGERELMRTLAQYPRMILQAAETDEPHRVAFFAHELATRFHAHWNRGKDLPDLRFVNEINRKLSYARLSLVASVGLVLASGLSILGVTAPDEMR
jgi:arginyl-tRNA synthetase